MRRIYIRALLGSSSSISPVDVRGPALLFRSGITGEITLHARFRGSLRSGVFIGGVVAHRILSKIENRAAPASTVYGPRRLWILADDITGATIRYWH